jgi:hypothetical protein
MSRPQSEVQYVPAWLVPVAALTAGNGLLLFALWCLLDYLLVRSSRYPEGVHDYDSLIPLLLIAPLVVDYFACRRFRLAPVWLICVLATLFAIPLSICFVVLFGTSFHLSIGGRL